MKKIFEKCFLLKHENEFLCFVILLFLFNKTVSKSRKRSYTGCIVFCIVLLRLNQFMDVALISRISVKVDNMK